MCDHRRSPPIIIQAGSICGQSIEGESTDHGGLQAAERGTGFSEESKNSTGKNVSQDVFYLYWLIFESYSKASELIAVLPGSSFSIIGADLSYGSDKWEEISPR